MFSLTPTAILDGTENSDTLTWNFNSGAEHFNYLATGETLILAYQVTVTDDDGTPLSDLETVTITITGTNDAPSMFVELLSGESFATSGRQRSLRQLRACVQRTRVPVGGNAGTSGARVGIRS